MPLKLESPLGPYQEAVMKLYCWSVVPTWFPGLEVSIWEPSVDHTGLSGHAEECQGLLVDTGGICSCPWTPLLGGKRELWHVALQRAAFKG